MEFNEKLIKLRKQNGLSQEQLGEKLNVTRQTVSKWELGESKPDMDKLLSISKLFNVSIDELTSENAKEEIKNDLGKSKTDFKDIGDYKPRKWLLIILIIVALVIVIVLLNKVITSRQNKKSIFESFYDTVTDKIGGSSINNTINNMINSQDVTKFNIDYSNGTKYGSSINNMLDDVITNNKTNQDKLISIAYKDINTSSPEEIKNLKKNFDTFTKYEVSLDYDENGYVNLITIEDYETNTDVNNDNSSNNIASNENNSSNEETSDFDKTMHNNQFGIYVGSRMGGVVNSLLEVVINNNKTNQDHIVSVNFNGSNTINESEISNIESQIETFSNYKISLDYDTNGFVNKVNIQKEV